MNASKRIGLIVLILGACIGCDQASKVTAQKFLLHAPAASYAHDLVRIQYTENTGAFLSLGATLPADVRFWLLVLLTGAFLAVALVYLLAHTLHPVYSTACSLIIGGGVGNLIDRVANQGAVIDFMNIGIGPLRTGIFNVADIAITVGVGMFLYLAFKGIPFKDLA